MNWRCRVQVWRHRPLTPKGRGSILSLQTPLPSFTPHAF